MEKGLYSQLVILCRKGLKITEENKNKNEINSSSKVSLQDNIVGLILILIVLKKILVHVNLSYLGKYFKGVTIHKIQIRLKCLRLQSEIQNMWKF